MRIAACLHTETLGKGGVSGKEELLLLLHLAWEACFLWLCKLGRTGTQSQVYSSVHIHPLHLPYTQLQHAQKLALMQTETPEGSSGLILAFVLMKPEPNFLACSSARGVQAMGFLPLPPTLFVSIRAGMLHISAKGKMSAFSQAGSIGAALGLCSESLLAILKGERAICN